MTSDSSSPLHRSVPSIGSIGAAVLAASCLASHPDVEAEKSIAAALALPDTAVQFRTEGGPVDALAAPAEALSLDEAIRRAVDESPELQAALARVRTAQAEADLAGLLPNPILSLVFRFPEGGGGPDVEAGIAADLLALLQRPRRASAAWNRLQGEAASALSSALDVVAETQELYANVQAFDELVPLLEARLAVLERLREVARTRLELGEGTRREVTSLDAERTELEVDVSRRRQELRRARLVLARRVGEPSGGATWRLDPWQGPQTIATEEAVWIATALRARPEILAIEWEIRARGDETALSRWAGLDGTSVGVDAERDGNWSVGPSASAPLPIFDTGSARERRARALASEAQHRWTEVQRRVVQEVRTSLASLTGAQENLGRVARDLVPLQERRRAEIEEAYRGGLVDVTALLLAEQALQSTQAQRVELEHEVSAALVRLRRAVGGTAAFISAVSGESERFEP